MRFQLFRLTVARYVPFYQKGLSLYAKMFLSMLVRCRKMVYRPATAYAALRGGNFLTPLYFLRNGVLLSFQHLSTRNAKVYRDIGVLKNPRELNLGRSAACSGNVYFSIIIIDFDFDKFLKISHDQMTLDTSGFDPSGSGVRMPKIKVIMKRLK